MTSTSNSIKDVYVDAMVYRLILFRYITKYFILYIQQVVLKIIKHAHEETTDAAQGGLLGLVKDSSLEITNCFPFPNPNKPENIDLGKF